MSMTDHLPYQIGFLRQVETPCRDVQPYRNSLGPKQAFDVRNEPADGEVLPRRECLRLLASAHVGRIVYSRQALPAVEPVDFFLDGETVVIRVNEASRLAKAIERAVVAFEADEYDAAAGTGWSVTIVGESFDVAKPNEVARLSGLVREHWAQDGKDHLVRISTPSVTGHRICPPL